MATLKFSKESLLKYRAGQEEANVSALDLKVARSNALFDRLGKKKTNQDDADRGSNEYRIGWLEGKLEYQKKHKAVLAKTNKNSAEAQLLIARLHSAQKDFKALKESQLMLNRSTQNLSDQLQHGVQKVDEWEIRSDASQERLEEILGEAEHAQKKAEEIVSSVDQVTNGLIEQSGDIDKLTQQSQELLGRTEESRWLAESVLVKVEEQQQAMEKDFSQQMQSYENIEERVGKTAESVHQSYRMVEDGLHQVDKSLQKVSESHQQVELSHQRVELSHQQVEESQQQVRLSYDKVLELAQETQERIAEALSKEQGVANFAKEAEHYLDGMKAVSEKTETQSALNQALSDKAESVLSQVEADLKKNAQARESIDEVFERAQEIERQLKAQFNELSSSNITQWQQRYEKVEQQVEEQIEQQKRQRAEQADQFSVYQDELDNKLADFDLEKSKINKLANTTHHNIEITRKQQTKLEAQLEDAKRQKAQTSAVRDEIAQIKETINDQIDSSKEVLSKIAAGLQKSSVDHEIISQHIEQAQGVDAKLKGDFNEYINRWQQQSKQAAAEQQQSYLDQISQLNEFKTNLDQGIDVRVARAIDAVHQDIEELRSKLDGEQYTHGVGQQQLLDHEESTKKIIAESEQNKRYIVATLKQARITAVKCNRINEQCVKLLDHVNASELHNNTLHDALRLDMETVSDKTEAIRLESDETKNQVAGMLEQLMQQERDLSSLRVSANKQRMFIKTEVDRWTQKDGLIDSHLSKIDEAVRLSSKVNDAAKAKVDSYIGVIEKATTSFDEARAVTLANLAKTKSLHEAGEQLNEGMQALQSDVELGQNAFEQVKAETIETSATAKRLNELTQSKQIEYDRLVTDVRGVREEAFRLSSANQKVVEEASGINANSRQTLSQAREAEKHIQEIENSVNQALGQMEGVYRETQQGQSSIDTLLQKAQQSFKDLGELEQSVEAQKHSHQQLVDETAVKLSECEQQVSLSKDYAEQSREAVESSVALVKKNVALQDEARQINQSTSEKALSLEAHYQQTQQLTDENKSLAESLTLVIETQKQEMLVHNDEQDKIVHHYEEKLLASEATNENLESSLKQAQQLNKEQQILKEQIDGQLNVAMQQQAQFQQMLEDGFHKQEGYQKSLVDAQGLNRNLQDKVTEYEGRLQTAESISEKSDTANQALKQKLVEIEKVNETVLTQVEQYKRQNNQFCQQLEEAQTRNKETKLTNKESQLTNKEYRLTLRELRSDVNDLRQQTQMALNTYPTNAMSRPEQLVRTAGDSSLPEDTQRRILLLEEELEQLRAEQLPIEVSEPSFTEMTVDIGLEQDRDVVLDQLQTLSDVVDDNENIKKADGTAARIRNFMLSAFITIAISGTAGLVAYDGSDYFAGQIATMMIVSDEVDMQQLEILLNRAADLRNKNDSLPLSKPQGIVTLLEKKDTYQWPLESDSKEAQIRHQKSRNGILLVAEKGSPVLAINGGTVVYSGAGIRGFGNLIILQHEGELLSIYGNNKDIDVVEGDLVLKGQVIGSVGEMGPGGAGLYFEIRYQGEVEDPYLYFADSGAA